MKFKHTDYRLVTNEQLYKILDSHESRSTKELAIASAELLRRIIKIVPEEPKKPVLESEEVKS